MKRFNLPLTACVLIVLSVLLVSCVQQAPGTVESAETVELELMLAPEGVFGDITPESYSMQLLADRTGFNFAFRQIPREFLGERIATTLASGDLPDIMQLGLPADSTGTTSLVRKGCSSRSASTSRLAICPISWPRWKDSRIWRS